jgi:ATP-dependent DNA ligase
LTKKWDGIYVGRRKGDDLIYAGKVDHGFDKTSAADLQKRLKPLIRRTQPYTKRIAHKGIWVEPKLLAEIEYRAKSAEGKVRHPFFRGAAGGPVMDAFDRFWQWADKPLESPLTIPAELHEAVMGLAREDRRDRAAVNQAAARVPDPER